VYYSILKYKQAGRDGRLTALERTPAPIRTKSRTKHPHGPATTLNIHHKTENVLTILNIIFIYRPPPFAILPAWYTQHKQRGRSGRQIRNEGHRRQSVRSEKHHATSPTPPPRSLPQEILRYPGPSRILTAARTGLYCKQLNGKM
jgi:hypothetical protein